MPALTGQPALDVAIGLFFVFFLLSVLCSAINEAIATLLAWRSETLLTALRSMLAETGAVPVHPQQPAGQATGPRAGLPAAPAVAVPAAMSADDAETRTMQVVAAPPAVSRPEPSLLILPQLLDHPLIRSQVDETARNALRRTVPSYLQPRVFALALLDTLSDRSAPGDTLFARVTKSVEDLQNPHLKGALDALLKDAAGDVERLRDGIEAWFDATMTRASGWYKRRIQISLWVIAAAVTFAFNADAGQIARALWKDPVVRASVVAEAQQAAGAGDRSDLGGDGNTSADQTLTAKVNRVSQLKLPLGWSFKRADPRWPDNVLGFVGKLVGLLATVAALSMGAPFWFDLLGRVSRVRGSGGRPAPAT